MGMSNLRLDAAVSGNKYNTNQCLYYSNGMNEAQDARMHVYRLSSLHIKDVQSVVEDGIRCFHVAIFKLPSFWSSDRSIDTIKQGAVSWTQ